MIEWIKENWELYLLISFLPFLIVYPWVYYQNKKADKALMNKLLQIFLDLDKDKKQ